MFENFGPRALMVGALLVVIAAVQAVRTVVFQRSGRVVEGVVVRIDEANDGDTPIVRFRDQRGAEHEFRVTAVSSSEPWEVGRRWPVRYDLDNPERAEIDAPLQRWSGVVVSLAGAAVLLIVGAVLVATKGGGGTP